MTLLLAAFLIYFNLKEDALDYTVSCPKIKSNAIIDIQTIFL